MHICEIAIYGAGGFAREVAWLAESCSSDNRPIKVVCFIDDNESTHGSMINDIPSMSLESAIQRFPNAAVVGGVGTPKVRQALMQKAMSAGFSFETLVHPRVECSKWVQIGEGAVVCAGNILTTNVRLGEQVQINLDCTIGHDVEMGSYTTLAPGVHVSGCVQFGERVYVGTGAVIINGTADKPIVIGDDAVIGAGACVTKSVDAGATVVGIPAKPLRQR